MPYLPELHTTEEDVAFFSRLLRESNVLVAELRGEIVGFCVYRKGWLDHLYVHPRHQRRQIGSALLSRAMDANAELRLWVFQRNAEAIRLYERAGFRLVKRTDGLGNEERMPDALFVWTRPE